MQYIIVVLTKGSTYPQTESKGHSHDFRIQDYSLIQQPCPERLVRKEAIPDWTGLPKSSSYRLHQPAE